jgi:YgiT-type zinc finger domain-containing protein
MKRCYKCKGEKLEKEMVEERVKIGARTFVGMLPVTRCSSCGEETFAGPDLEALDLTISGELARHGEISADAFSFMRRALGVRAMDLAEFLDVTPETVSRWEHDRQPIDRGAIALLSAMVVDRLEGRTTTIDRLRALLKPEPLPRLVRLVPQSHSVPHS